MVVKKTGWRRPARGSTFNEAKGKRMWTAFYRGHVFYTRAEEPAKSSDDSEYEVDHEVGPEIKLFLPSYSTQEINWEFNLTELTHDEYLHVRKIFAAALKEAEPIIKMRDADAKQRLERGQIAPSRAYRSVSRLFTPDGEVE